MFLKFDYSVVFKAFMYYLKGKSTHFYGHLFGNTISWLVFEDRYSAFRYKIVKRSLTLLIDSINVFTIFSTLLKKDRFLYKFIQRKCLGCYQILLVTIAEAKCIFMQRFTFKIVFQYSKIFRNGSQFERDKNLWFPFITVLIRWMQKM